MFYKVIDPFYNGDELIKAGKTVDGKDFAPEKLISLVNLKTIKKLEEQPSPSPVAPDAPVTSTTQEAADTQGGITDVTGIGKTSAEKLLALGIATAAELEAKLNDEEVKAILGANLAKVKAYFQQ